MREVDGIKEVDCNRLQERKCYAHDPAFEQTSLRAVVFTFSLLECKCAKK